MLAWDRSAWDKEENTAQQQAHGAGDAPCQVLLPLGLLGRHNQLLPVVKCSTGVVQHPPSTLPRPLLCSGHSHECLKSACLLLQSWHENEQSATRLRKRAMAARTAILQPGALPQGRTVCVMLVGWEMMVVRTWETLEKVVGRLPGRRRARQVSRHGLEERKPERAGVLRNVIQEQRFGLGEEQGVCLRECLREVAGNAPAAGLAGGWGSAALRTALFTATLGVLSFQIILEPVLCSGRVHDDRAVGTDDGGGELHVSLQSCLSDVEDGHGLWRGGGERGMWKGRGGGWSAPYPSRYSSSNGRSIGQQDSPRKCSAPPQPG